MNNDINFTKGNLFPKMLKFSIPLIFSIVLQALYGAVDLIIVGNYGDTFSQAAVATGSHIIQTITAIITGFTMGITVVIGRFIGSMENEKIGKVIGNVTIIFTIIGFLITGITIGLESTLVKLLNVQPESVEGCLEYIFICSVGFIFVVAYNVISGFFRGVGNSNLPLLFIAISCVFNIILDFVFVKGLHMYASGAAIATIMAQAISVVFSSITMWRKREVFHITKEGFKLDSKIIKDIFKLGFPIALQDTLVNVSFLIIHSLINSMGNSESAAIGIGEKLFVILSIVPMSYITVMATVVSQNEGAGETKRSKLALKEGCMMSFFFGFITFLISYFGAEFISSIFSKDPEVIKCSVQYLQSSSFEYLLISIGFCFIGYFNGKGKTFFVMTQGLISTFLFRIPLSFYYRNLPDANMYMMGIPIPISAAITVFLCVGYFLILSFIEGKQHKCNEIKETNNP